MSGNIMILIQKSALSDARAAASPGAAVSAAS
jgi:hypothetical protein